MKKKSKKHNKNKHSGFTLLERLPNNRGEWLELIIKNTIRAIGPDPRKSEHYLIEQKDRLANELSNWRKNEGKN